MTNPIEQLLAPALVVLGAAVAPVLRITGIVERDDARTPDLFLDWPEQP